MPTVSVRDDDITVTCQKSQLRAGMHNYTDTEIKDIQYVLHQDDSKAVVPRTVIKQE